MKAMVLDAPRTSLRAAELVDPQVGADEVLLQVRACAVCRTDLHVIALAPRAGVETSVEVFPLAEANDALDRLRHGDMRGAVVLVPRFRP